MIWTILNYKIIALIRIISIDIKLIRFIWIEYLHWIQVK